MRSRIMELYQTSSYMSSDDYEERFVAEYYQTRIRYNRLRHALIKDKARTLEYEFDCPKKLLKKQLKDMKHYLEDLEVRAEIEDIDLRAEGTKLLSTF